MVCFVFVIKFVKSHIYTHITSIMVKSQHFSVYNIVNGNDVSWISSISICETCEQS